MFDVDIPDVYRKAQKCTMQNEDGLITSELLTAHVGILGLLGLAFILFAFSFWAK